MTLSEPPQQALRDPETGHLVWSEMAGAEPERPTQGLVEPSVAEVARFWTSLQASPTPMMLAGDNRVYVEANPAACQLLGLSLDAIRRLRVDDLAAPELRAGVAASWADFLRVGWMAGQYQLQLLDGRRVEVEFTATANIAPGRHLSVFHVRRAPIASLAGGRPALTQREREVLRMVAMGAENREISERLMIGTETVRTHMSRIMRKLGVHNRAHAVAIALTGRLIDLPQWTGPSPPAERKA